MMLGNEVLSHTEIMQIIEAACLILEKTGTEIENTEILARLSDFGGDVNDLSGRIRFKKSFTENFIHESEKVSWENRPVTFTASAEIYQGYLLDPADNKYKEWTEQRFFDYIRLARALPNIDSVSMLGCPLKEVPVSLQPLYEKLYAWKYGISAGSSIWDTNLCGKIYEMWQVYASYTGKPTNELFNGTVYLISPFKFGKIEAEQFMWFYKKGLRVAVGTLGSLGGTTPVTLAGALALHLAENLFLNILTRAFFGGKTLSMANSVSSLDMLSAAFQYGRPEQTLLSIAGAQIAKYLGSYYGGHGGLSDAKVPGHEAGVQKASSAIFNAVTYGHGNISAGLLGVDEIYSPIQMILDDELTGSLKMICKGIEVNEETLALDVIDEIGPGGNFLDTDHTSLNFRKSLWQPDIWSREMYSAWKETGKKNDIDKAKQKYDYIMSGNKHMMRHISEETEKRLMEIIKK